MATDNASEKDTEEQKASQAAQLPADQEPRATGKSAEEIAATNKAAVKSGGGADQVQAAVDDEQEQGYRGNTPDPTPNEHYTVAGVLAGKPTPETDYAQSLKATGSVRDNLKARD